MKRILAFVVAGVLLGTLVSSPAIAVVKPGASCNKAGAVSTVAGKKYTCVKSGKKLVWNKGVVVVKPTPIPAPTIDYSQVKLSWISADPLVILPGTLVDPDPNSLQDYGLNSSFTVQATINDLPLRDILLTWTTTSLNGQIQVLSDKTDEKGLARIWYFSGVEASQVIGVKTSEGLKSLSYHLELTEPTPNQRLFGRPVDVWFSAPHDNYSRVDITARINSNPLSTYYAFANFPNFYTGVQMIDCSILGDDPRGQFVKPCATARGHYIGHEGHFSVWDWTDPQGNIVHPIIVEEPNTTKCLTFGGEGTGQMCLAAVNWDVGSVLTIKVESLLGAPADYQRIRTTIVSDDSKINQLLAVIDVPGGVNLESFAAFNENWQLNQYANCGAVEMRSFTILEVKFYKGELRISPTASSAIGNTTSENGILCQNYSFARDGSGIEISSGGLSRWANIKDALSVKSNYPGYYFPTPLQSQVLWSPINLKGFGN